MRLINLNVNVFEKNNSKLKAFLIKTDPDIVCFQEVSRKIGLNVDPGYLSLPAIEEATPKLIHKFFGPCWIAKDFRQTNFHQERYFKVNYGDWLEIGLLICSKYPIYHGKLVFVQGNLSFITNWSSWPKKDNRAVQIADLMIDNNTPNLRVINYHGIWSREKAGNHQTLKANQTIVKHGKAVNYPVLICGDFNLFPNTKSMQILDQEFESLIDKYRIKTTRPHSNELSGRKRNVVDYIFISKKISTERVRDKIITDNQ